MLAAAKMSPDYTEPPAHAARRYDAEPRDDARARCESAEAARRLLLTARARVRSAADMLMRASDAYFDTRGAARVMTRVPRYKRVPRMFCWRSCLLRVAAYIMRCHCLRHSFCLRCQMPLMFRCRYAMRYASCAPLMLLRIRKIFFFADAAFQAPFFDRALLRAVTPIRCRHAMPCRHVTPR